MIKLYKALKVGHPVSHVKSEIMRLLLHINGKWRGFVGVKIFKYSFE